MKTRYLIAAGIVGVSALVAIPFVPPLVSMCLAYDGPADRGRTEQAAREGAGGSCCFGGTHTSDALNRMVNGAALGQSQPFWRGSMYNGLYQDGRDALGLGGPAQRGSYTDGGSIMGTGAREMRGPGGTIGPI